MSDYEWLVELAAKGLAQRDTYPMPASVSTPEAFYEVMARAALDAIGLRALLEEVARREDDLKLDSDPPEVDAVPPEVDADASNEDVDPPVEVVADETGTALSEEPAYSSASVQVPVTARRDPGGEECDTGPTGERTSRKVENVRLTRRARQRYRSAGTHSPWLRTGSRAGRWITASGRDRPNDDASRT